MKGEVKNFPYMKLLTTIPLKLNFSSSNCPTTYKVLVCNDCGTQRIVPVYCKDRVFCTICRGIFRKRAKSDFSSILDRIRGSRKVCFITLGVSSGEDGNNAIETLRTAFKRLRQRSYWKKRLQGGLVALEMAYKNGSWYPHLHMLVTGVFSEGELRKEWVKCSKVETASVDIRVWNGAPEKFIDYVTKMPEVPEVKQDELKDILRDKRLFSVVGSWYGVCRIVREKFKYTCEKCGCRKVVVFKYNGYLDCMKKMGKGSGPD